MGGPAAQGLFPPITCRSSDSLGSVDLSLGNRSQRASGRQPLCHLQGFRIAYQGHEGSRCSLTPPNARRPCRAAGPVTGRIRETKMWGRSHLPHGRCRLNGSDPSDLCRALSCPFDALCHGQGNTKHSRSTAQPTWSRRRSPAHLAAWNSFAHRRTPGIPSASSRSGPGIVPVVLPTRPCTAPTMTKIGPANPMAVVSASGSQLQQQGRDGEGGTHCDRSPDLLRSGKRHFPPSHLAASRTPPIHSRRNTVTDPSACPIQSSENSPRTASCAPAST
jgi:hypothetical protein